MTLTSAERILNSNPYTRNWHSAIDLYEYLRVIPEEETMLREAINTVLDSIYGMI